METICKNKTTYSKEKYMGLYNQYFKKYKKSYRLINIALVAAFIIGGVSYAVKENYIFSSVYMMFACLCIWLFFRGYYLKAQKMFIMEDTAYGSARSYDFGEEKFSVLMGQTTREMPYSKISGFVENGEEFGILIDDFLFVIDKSGFSEGSADVCRRLITREIKG